jgi:hypothetical protein
MAAFVRQEENVKTERVGHPPLPGKGRLRSEVSQVPKS